MAPTWSILTPLPISLLTVVDEIDHVRPQLALGQAAGVEPGGHFGGDDARRDGADADVLLGVLGGGGAREADEGVLAGA